MVLRPQASGVAIKTGQDEKLLLIQITVSEDHASGKPEKYLTGLADLFPAYSENKPIKNGDHGFKPY